MSKTTKEDGYKAGLRGKDDFDHELGKLLILPAAMDYSQGYEAGKRDREELEKSGKWVRSSDSSESSDDVSDSGYSYSGGGGYSSSSDSDSSSWGGVVMVILGLAVGILFLINTCSQSSIRPRNSQNTTGTRQQSAVQQQTETSRNYAPPPISSVCSDTGHGMVVCDFNISEGGSTIELPMGNVPSVNSSMFARVKKYNRNTNQWAWTSNRLV